MTNCPCCPIREARGVTEGPSRRPPRVYECRSILFVFFFLFFRVKVLELNLSAGFLFRVLSLGIGSNPVYSCWD